MNNKKKLTDNIFTCYLCGKLNDPCIKTRDNKTKRHLVCYSCWENHKIIFDRQVPVYKVEDKNFNRWIRWNHTNFRKQKETVAEKVYQFDLFQNSYFKLKDVDLFENYLKIAFVSLQSLQEALDNICGELQNKGVSRPFLDEVRILFQGLKLNAEKELEAVKEQIN